MPQSQAFQYLGLGLQHFPQHRKSLFSFLSTLNTNVLCQYEGYDSSPAVPVSGAAQASPPPIAATSSSPPPEQIVTGAPSVEPVVQEAGFPPIVDMAGGFPPAHVIHSEERIEYRDQDGNLLDEEQVKALEGKVEFHTRYETRTKLLDAEGNEILPSEAPESVAGPLVDAPNPETVKLEQKAEEGELKVREVEVDTESREVTSESAASPASEGVIPESAASEEAVVSESVVAVKEVAAEEVAPEKIVAAEVAEEAAEEVAEKVIAKSVAKAEAEVHTETKWEEVAHTETVVVDQDGNTVVE